MLRRWAASINADPREFVREDDVLKLTMAKEQTARTMKVFRGFLHPAFKVQEGERGVREIFLKPGVEELPREVRCDDSRVV